MSHSFGLLLDDYLEFQKGEIVRVVGQEFSEHGSILKAVSIIGDVRARLPLEYAVVVSAYWEVLEDVYLTDGSCLVCEGDRLISFDYLMGDRLVTKYYTYEGDDFVEIDEVYIDTRIQPLEVEGGVLC